MSTVLNGRVGKKRPRRSRGQVLRMMAIMQDGNSGEVPKEFLESGRTGRRNALPEIMSQQDAQSSTADLPARLQALATSEKSSISSSTPSASSGSEDLQCFLNSASAKRRDAICQIPCLDDYVKDSPNCRQIVIDEKMNSFLHFVESTSPGVPSDPSEPRGDIEASESLTYLNSDERLLEFLRSKMSQRRFALGSIRREGVAVGPSESHLDVSEDQPDFVDKYKVIRPNSGELRDAFEANYRDPNNPTPGPSASQSGDASDDTQKPSGS